MGPRPLDVGAHSRSQVKDNIPQAKTIPLFRCVKCGLLRLPIADDAAPPGFKQAVEGHTEPFPIAV